MVVEEVVVVLEVVATVAAAPADQAVALVPGYPVSSPR